MNLNNCLEITNGMVTVCCPIQKTEETLDFSTLLPKFNGCFAVNNSTVAFVKDNKLYVSPYTLDIVADLKDEGFTQTNSMNVPFSNGTYPKNAKPKWDRLRQMASDSYIKEYETNAESFAKGIGLRPLPKNILKRCFKMPHGGVPIKRETSPGEEPESRLCPLGNETGFDVYTARMIGKYDRNQGIVVFVYKDGHTYVAKGYAILDALRSAGFTEGHLIVPFSNREIITDPELAKKWEKLPRVTKIS